MQPPSTPLTRLAVIMAGGSGERFWPLSRQRRPKQLLRLTRADQTMLEEAIGRIAPLVGEGNVLIATSQALVAPIREAVAGLPPENVIGEPCKRNTAGALAFVAAHVLARHGAEAAATISLAVLTADHRIGDAEAFRATARAALEAAEQRGVLATIGVAPTRPETGYGYIEIPEGARPLGAGEPPVYPVAAFREKPDLATAEGFLATGRFFWNSGMFFWRMDRFMEELALASPPHAETARAMAESLRRGQAERLNWLFEGLEDISIDYALLERSRRVAVARAAFDWDDVGAWDALERAYPHDAQGNVAAGDPVLIDTRDCIVYNEPGAARMAVAAIGVEGLCVVVSGDAVLIVPKARAQEVKRAVAELKKRGAGQL